MALAVCLYSDDHDVTEIAFESDKFCVYCLLCE